MTGAIQEKTCTKCKIVKPLFEFHKIKGNPVSACIVCTHNYKAKYYSLNREALIEKTKKYRLENIDKWKTNAKNYCKENKEIIAVRMKEYQERNKENIKENKHDYYLKNKAGFSKNRKEYYQKNKEIEQARNLRYAEKNRDKISKHQAEYLKTPAGKITDTRHSHKRRMLGFDPINNWFKNSEFHHFHTADNKSLGLFIPASIHQSIRHDGNNGKNLDNINRVATAWLISDTATRARFLKYVVWCEASP